MLNEIESEISITLVGGVTLKFKYVRGIGGPANIDRILVTGAGEFVAPITLKEIKTQAEDLRHVVAEFERMEALPLM